MRAAAGHRFFTAGALLLAATLSLACASTPPAVDAEAAADATGVTAFTIRNNHPEGRDMIIYLDPEARGERRTLGTVPAGATATLNHDVPRGYYRMVAAHDLGELTSDRFNITGPSNITWTLSPSRVVVTRR